MMFPRRVLRALWVWSACWAATAALGLNSVAHADGNKAANEQTPHPGSSGTAGQNGSSTSRQSPSKPDEDPPSAEQQNTALRGQVVWLADAIKQRFGIDSDADVAHAYCALVTEDRQILPIVKDARGRGFCLDERLRAIDLELVVRRLPATGMIQVIRVYSLKQDGKYELDYWCDVCAIPMFELKACECCQGATRIRERRVGPRGEKQ